MSFLGTCSIGTRIIRETTPRNGRLKKNLTDKGSELLRVSRTKLVPKFMQQYNMMPTTKVAAMQL
jgi:hypothetical protein